MMEPACNPGVGSQRALQGSLFSHPNPLGRTKSSERLSQEKRQRANLGLQAQTHTLNINHRIVGTLQRLRGYTHPSRHRLPQDSQVRAPAL